MTDGNVGNVMHVTLDLSDALRAGELEAVVLVACLVMDQKEVVIAVCPVDPEGGDTRRFLYFLGGC